MRDHPDDRPPWWETTPLVRLCYCCFLRPFPLWTPDTEPPHFRSLVKLVWCQVVSKEVLARTEIPWGRLYLTLHCHHQNDFCIKMGSNESHSDVSLIVRGIVTRQYPQKKRAEAKSNQSLSVYQTNTFTPRPNWLTSFCCVTLNMATLYVRVWQVTFNILVILESL